MIKIKHRIRTIFRTLWRFIFWAIGSIPIWPNIKYKSNFLFDPAESLSYMCFMILFCFRVYKSSTGCEKTNAWASRLWKLNQIAVLVSEKSACSGLHENSLWLFEAFGEFGELLKRTTVNDNGAGKGSSWIHIFVTNLASNFGFPVLYHIYYAKMLLFFWNFEHFDWSAFWSLNVLFSRTYVQCMSTW